MKWHKYYHIGTFMLIITNPLSLIMPKPKSINVIIFVTHIDPITMNP